ncbi:hypothetical protein Zm00014a_019757 [Zea mays]|uniref:Uncharacterized protein n=1 Tax=Zea mays TaxID=4577 RepID=A0A317Y2W9_MAIZE|nr:hypothetical protein Zm00014a_019757 [Zea mays]
MEPVALNRERATADRLKRIPMLFDDYRDKDFYELSRKYSIVARAEVKFPIEPRYRDRQHFVLSDINGAKIEAMTTRYETVKHFNSLLHEKHVYKMHNVEFGLDPGEFHFRHMSGPMELYLTQQTLMESYTVPIQMPPFPKHIFLNLADIAELPNSTLLSASSLRIKQQYTSICSITTPIILNQFKKLWWHGTIVSLLLDFLKNKGIVDRV